ncbi:MAG: dihydroneopterin aldolase [Succinivibrio sp.]|nr:dihydroneopterin aldolase [Succinivibrio sp.]
MDCIIGILPYERENTQPLMISIELECDLKKAGYSGDLDDSINYAELANRVREYTVQRKARLVEELGVELCDLILEEFRPKKVCITLNKPLAVENCDGVGIKITKVLE